MKNMREYGSMWTNRKNHIRVRFLLQESSPERGANPAEIKKETAESNHAEIYQFSRTLLIDFLNAKNGKEAQSILEKYRGMATGKPEEKIYTTKISTLSLWKTVYFPNNWDKVEISKEQVNAMKVSIGLASNENLEINKEQEIQIKQFISAHPKDEYINWLIKYLLEHPFEAEKQIDAINAGRNEDSYLWKYFSELNALGQHAWLKPYQAILDTLKVLIKTEQFDKDTGVVSKFLRKIGWDGYEAKFYPSYLRQILIDAANEKKVPASANQESIFQWLSKEQELYLKENPPDKLYNNFLDYLKKWSGLTPQDVQEYIKKQEEGMNTILNINEDSPIAQIYKKKFQQMRAMSTYDILYDQNIWSKIKGAVTGNNLDAFIVEAQKWETTPGSVGYDGNGKFKFFPTWEMKDVIMKNGEISWECDSAWGAYIKWVNGNYSELKKIFWETGIDALAIYLKNKNYNSSILDNNEWFKSFIEWEVPTNNEFANQESTNEWEEALSIEKDFPRLKEFLERNPGKFNEIQEIPRRVNGGIDGISLILALIKDKNITPETIQELKTTLVADLKLRVAQAEEKRTESVTEIQKTHKDWKSALESLGISPKISIKNAEGKEEVVDIGERSIEYAYSENETHAILVSLEKRESELTDSPEDEKKKSLIKHLKEVLQQKKEIDSITATRDAVAATWPDDMAKASKEWEDAQMHLIDAGYKNAERWVTERNSKENREKEWVSINLYREYGLPSDFWELTKPRNLNTIEKAISALNSKENRSRDENIFLAQLRDAREQIKADAQAVRATMELQKSYPEFQNTISNIREWSRELYQNLSEKDIQRYTYISEFWDNSRAMNNMEVTLARMPPGESISLSKVMPELWDSFASDCNIIKSENPIYCSINFPADSWIPTAVNIPIKSIKSYTSQVELFAQCNLQSLIGLIPSLDRNITNITGKKTSAISDGTFDEWEARRNMEFISRLLLENYDRNMPIDEMARKIKSQYPSPRDVQGKLIELGILRREWWYHEFALQEKIWSLMKQA